jgi:hypothetical protein
MNKVGSYRRLLPVPCCVLLFQMIHVLRCYLALPSYRVTRDRSASCLSRSYRLWRGATRGNKPFFSTIASGNVLAFWNTQYDLVVHPLSIRAHRLLPSTGKTTDRSLHSFPQVLPQKECGLPHLYMADMNSRLSRPAPERPRNVASFRARSCRISPSYSNIWSELPVSYALFASICL